MAVQPFPDVVGKPYAEAIETLHRLGLVIGRPDGTYDPDTPLTRGEYAESLARVVGLHGPLGEGLRGLDFMVILRVIGELSLLYAMLPGVPVGQSVETPSDAAVSLNVNGELFSIVLKATRTA